MSKKHHNYTNYSKPQQPAPVVEPEVKVEAPVVEEAPVATPDPVVEETNEIIGVVTDCLKLNVRKEPNKDADILCEIMLAAEVMVDKAKSTEDFYKVVTASGVEGYCMKKFISI